MGPVTTSRSSGSVRCHRIAVKDVVIGKMELHHFVLDDVKRNAGANVLFVTSAKVTISK